MPDFSSRRMVHVHVPFAEFAKYEAFLRANRLSVEVYIGTRTMDTVTPDGLRAFRDSLDWEHTLSVHSPFMDLCPGAIDSKIAAASLERYLQVMSFCEILRPASVVFHAGYEKWKYADEVDLWLDQSLKTWRRVIEEAEKTNTKVAIENIVDEGPGHLKLLAGRMAHPLFGLCLDVGHRELFSKLPVQSWVEGMSPHIFELHLHDNLGEKDDHLPIGYGRIDFPAFFAALRSAGADPIYTIEAHSPEDTLKSLEALKKYI